MPEQTRIALLIDCDNASHHSIEGVLEELSKFGRVNVRHAHGDWNSSILSGWIKTLHPHAIRPVQQFAYTKGKNATDLAMIIDAMDLLYSKSIDAFALMTSDSDFTPLVMRIVESGLPVYGFGEEKTPTPFVDACSTFIYTENLTQEKEDKTHNKSSEKKSCTDLVNDADLEKKSHTDLVNDAVLVKLLRTAVEQTSEDDDWAHMGKVGLYISNNSSFSPINYGYKKLGALIRASELFEVNMRKMGKGGTAMYIKDKSVGLESK